MATVKGYKPHANQLVIHNAINNESAKYYGLCIGRQFGKSLLGENQSLYWMINNKNSNTGWVSPIYKQSKKVYKELKAATESSGFFKYNDTDLIIEGFSSTLQFFSAERPDGIRGFTFDYLICDEVDFMKDGIWEEVLQPTVLVRGKKVLFLSTPKGRRMMFKLKQLAQNEPNYLYFHFTSYDNPLIDSKEIDSIRDLLPDHIFRQEYLAEYVDDISGLFKNVKACISDRIVPVGKLFGGLDIGRADDYTVLTIGDKNGNVSFVERWRHDDWTNIINKVAKRIKEQNALVYVEVNNQGDVFFEMLKKLVGNLIEPFTTTSKSKPIMIEDLAVQFEQQTIQIPSINWFVDELESFTYIFDPKSRRVKYSAPPGVHDDGVISLSLYNQARTKLNQRGKYIILK